MYRLLIVDDEALIRKGLHTLIPWEELGFYVVSAVGSAAEALTVIEREPVDVLLTDIQMPGLNGLELCAAARKNIPRLRVIIISGYSRFEYAKTALQLQADDYILKPLKPEEIKTIFRRIQLSIQQERLAETEKIKNKQAQQQYYLLGKLEKAVYSEERNCGEENEAQRIVVFSLPESESKRQECMRELSGLEISGQIFCQDNLLVFYGVAKKADLFWQQAVKGLSSFQGVGCRGAVSPEFYFSEDIFGVFLYTMEQLRQRESEQYIALSRQEKPKENIMIMKIRQELFRSVETGQFLLLQQEVKRTIQLLSGRSFASACLLCSRLVADAVRYFRLYGVEGFLLFGSEKEMPVCVEELENALLKDMKKIQEKIQCGDAVCKGLLQRAKQQIEKNYANSAFSLGHIAETLNMNYNYLSTMFTKETGQSLKAYLTHVRMEKARELLLAGNLKVYEIAGQVGYSNPRYFTDAFRKNYGVPPKEYVQRMGGAGYE